jgi:hypothetical protein
MWQHLGADAILVVLLGTGKVDRRVLDCCLAPTVCWLPASDPRRRLDGEAHFSEPRLVACWMSTAGTVARLH